MPRAERPRGEGARRVRSGAGARFLPVLAVLLVGGLWAPGAAALQTSSGEAPERPPREAGQRADDPGRIQGTITDAETGEPLAGVIVRAREANRGDLSHRDGSYHLENVPPGSYTLSVQLIGYATRQERVEVGEGEVVRLDFALARSAISLPGIVVTGLGRARGVEEAYRPTSVLSGEELNRRLQWSLPATLAHEPGLAAQSFGPVATQPVIRGMGGDRILVLEDGQRTGDLSTTAPDHAVGIDPIGAQRMEVVRGPAGLLYGSNALGGVVNVIREEVPRELPEAFGGTATLEGASVNRGTTAAVQVRAPLADRFALRGELSGRFAGDIRTPHGVLPSTDTRGINVSAGASWIEHWGHVGLSYRDYVLDHGVPGEFQGEQIPGAHAGGVDVETRRRVGRFRAGHYAGLGPFASVELEGNLIHYEHLEIEGVLETGRRITGTSFDQLTASGNLVARHEHEANGWFAEGAVGGFALWQDLITGGSFPGTRDARETNVALYGYEELARAPLRLQVGARWDWHRIEPVDTRAIETGDEPVPVRERTFGDLSGSVAALLDLAPGWTLGAGVARAFRAPSVPELFSDGPHLADFSYDIGNPELDREVGLGVDLFVRAVRSRLNLEASVFQNAVSNYIHYRPTGRIDPRFGRFPVFAATGRDALFRGADGRAQWEAVPSLVLDGTVSYVRAYYRGDGEPLPQIPPLNGGLRIRWEPRGYHLTAGWDAAARQHRVPHALPSDEPGGPDLLPERPTDGRNLFHLGGGVRWTRGDQVHSVSLKADNVLNTAWRDHLSRAKEVAPEPGRNLQVLYRITF